MDSVNSVMNVSSPFSVSQPVSAGVVDDDTASPLLGRRLARVAAGGVLALGPGLVLVQRVVLHELQLRDAAFSLIPLIALLWVAAGVAFVVAGRFGRSAAALSVFDADGFARASFAVPALGVALAGPLSLHALVGVPVWLAGVALGDHGMTGATLYEVVTAAAEAFDEWVSLALVGTVHVHIAFAIALMLGAFQVASGVVVRKIELWPSVVLSFVPGIIILFPPVVVWVTGLLLSRLFLRRAARWFVDDSAVSPGR